MRKTSTDRSKLVKKWLEHSVWNDKVYDSLPGSKDRGTGIYVLYNGKKIYYIRLSYKSLRGRLKQHTKDRHKGKWDNFSFYQVPKTRYIKDIETILLRVYRSTGNRMKGNLREKYNLSGKIK